MKLGIASYFSHDATQVEGARPTLANAILSVTCDDSRDAEVLKRAALQVMARNYPSLQSRPTGGRTGFIADGRRNHASKDSRKSLSVTYRSVVTLAL
jgi:hypothetical protein